MFGTRAMKSPGLLDAGRLDLLAREYVHRHRHVAERLAAPACGHEDLVYLFGFAGAVRLAPAGAARPRPRRRRDQR